MARMSERELIKQAYPNPTWAKKVDAMGEQQVHALYIRLRNQGKI